MARQAFFEWLSDDEVLQIVTHLPHAAKYRIMRASARLQSIARASIKLLDDPILQWDIPSHLICEYQHYRCFECWHKDLNKKNARTVRKMSNRNNYIYICASCANDDKGYRHIVSASKLQKPHNMKQALFRLMLERMNLNPYAENGRKRFVWYNMWPTVVRRTVTYFDPKGHPSEELSIACYSVFGFVESSLSDMYGVVNHPSKNYLVDEHLQDTSADSGQ